MKRSIGIKIISMYKNEKGKLFNERIYKKKKKEKNFYNIGYHLKIIKITNKTIDC